MRIPEDILFRFFSPKNRRPPSQDAGTEPVDQAPASHDALARERSRAWQKQAEEAAAQRQARAYEEEQHGGEERRKNDRRKRQVNVLLDTRTNPSRRHRPIDVKA